MKRAPLSTIALAVLGGAGTGLGVFLMLKPCSELECVVKTIGAVFAAWGLIAVAGLVRNALGLVAFLSALLAGLFLGLVFLFARRPVGIVPPLLLIGLAAAEKDMLRAYYFKKRAEAPATAPAPAPWGEQP